MAQQEFSVSIAGKESRNFVAARVPGVGEHLSTFNDQGVQGLYKVTRVLWSRAENSVRFKVTVYVVETQP